METIPISEFKAKCLGFLEKTRQNGDPWLITKHGVPIAKVMPIRPKVARRRRGSLKGMARIHGDIISFDTSKDWEVLS